jgi:hypothetical protein
LGAQRKGEHLYASIGECPMFQKKKVVPSKEKERKRKKKEFFGICCSQMYSL